MFARAVILLSMAAATVQLTPRAAAQVETPDEADRTNDEWWANPGLPDFAAPALSAAPPNVTIEPELREAVAALDAVSWSAREVATLDLLDGPGSVPQLCALLTDNALSAEQRFRLLLVLEERIVSAPSGAIGVRVDRRFLPDIVIEELLPDLPASAVLRRGDRVTHLDGAPLASWNQLVASVQQRPPGTEVVLGVERRTRAEGAEGADVEGAEDGAEGVVAIAVERFDVRFALGSAEKLRDPLTGEPQRNDDLARERRAIATEAMERWAPAPFRAGLDPDRAGDLIGIGDVPILDGTADPVTTGELLARHLEMIMAGDAALDEVRRVMLSRRLDALESLIADPRLPPDKKAQFQEVARRALGLLGDR